MVTYKLELLDTMRIHNVFHVSLSKPHKANGAIHPPPPPTLENDDMSFEVECVLAHEV